MKRQEVQDPFNEFTQPLEYQVFVFLGLERKGQQPAPSWAAQLVCPQFAMASKELRVIKSLSHLRPPVTHVCKQGFGNPLKSPGQTLAPNSLLQPRFEMQSPEAFWFEQDGL